MAVGLDTNQYYNSYSHGFYTDTAFEIQSLYVNGIQSKFIKEEYSIEFDINLHNLEKAKIHIIYKESKDLKKLSKGEIEQRKVYRQNYYGVGKSLEGQMAKFILILKGSFDIVNFNEYFLIRNENNKKEIEYVWGGRVPKEGKRVLITFCKRQAIWSFFTSSKICSENEIKETTYYHPIEFIGGNNEIINIKASSPQSTKIMINEQKRQYNAKYINTSYKEAEFIIEGKLINKCKGEWKVDISDEEIEKKMPKEDVKDKEKLKKIAKKIIDNFDKENRDSDFEYLDYMKIGLWVHKNINYNYEYLGKTQYSAMDIYNMRKGVCHHFTRLSNALLYSIGYKVIYVSGYAIKDIKEINKESYHAWSLIKLGNKWYPFDSTWGIVSGKLPISHLFEKFFNESSRFYGKDNIQFGNDFEKIKYEDNNY